MAAAGLPAAAFHVLLCGANRGASDQQLPLLGGV